MSNLKRRETQGTWPCGHRDAGGVPVKTEWKWESCHCTAGMSEPASDGKVRKDHPLAAAEGAGPDLYLLSDS